MTKKKRIPRTNAMRLLDAHSVPYQVLVFSPAIHSATGVAETTGLDPALVYKTLVIERQRDRSGPAKALLVMLAGDSQVDLSALATSVGEKKLSMATHRDAESLTGLQVGGISALALLNRGFDIYIDLAAQHLEQVAISAGRRGVNLLLAVSDLIRVAGASWVDATGENGPAKTPD